MLSDALVLSSYSLQDKLPSLLETDALLAGHVLTDPARAAVATGTVRARTLRVGTFFFGGCSIFPAAAIVAASAVRALAIRVRADLGRHGFCPGNFGICARRVTEVVGGDTATSRKLCFNREDELLLLML